MNWQNRLSIKLQIEKYEYDLSVNKQGTRYYIMNTDRQTLSTFTLIALILEVIYSIWPWLELWFGWWPLLNTSIIQHAFAFVWQHWLHIYFVNRRTFLISGNYECKLRGHLIVFRQVSKGMFIVKDTPLIQVIPVATKVSCEVGKEASLNCIVSAPYMVIFKGIPSAGKPNVIISFLNQVFYLYFTECWYMSRLNVAFCSFRWRSQYHS